MIEVRWEVLEEEGRVVKAICDLARIPCKYVSKYSDISNEKSEGIKIVSSIDDLVKLGEQLKELSGFFGESKKEKKLVNNLLYLHQKNFKGRSRMPIIEYYHNFNPPLPKDILKTKWFELKKSLKQIQKIVAHRKGKYICGEQLTIADLILYFDACNLLYFKKNYADYPQIGEWFTLLYEIKEIKAITHLWFSMVKEIMLSMRKKREKERPKL